MVLNLARYDPRRDPRGERFHDDSVSEFAVAGPPTGDPFQTLGLWVRRTGPGRGSGGRFLGGLPCPPRRQGRQPGGHDALGLPVPPGCTVTTEACNAYLAAGGSRTECGTRSRRARAVEKPTGKRFGDPQNPLLVSCRSGAKFSMPGMMDTVLNIGLNDEVAEGLARADRRSRASSSTLSPAGADVRLRRARRLRRAVRGRPGRARSARGVEERRGPRRGGLAARSRASSAASFERSRPCVPARSRSSRSAVATRPCSTAGTASAPSTTAMRRRSRTTWARR